MLVLYTVFLNTEGQPRWIGRPDVTGNSQSVEEGLKISDVTIVLPEEEFELLSLLDARPSLLV